MRDTHYTIYLTTGKRQVIEAGEHNTFQEAATAAGYGAIASLIDFYAYGIDTNYAWDTHTKSWKRTVPLIPIDHKPVGDTASA